MYTLNIFAGLMGRDVDCVFVFVSTPCNYHGTNNQLQGLYVSVEQLVRKHHL